MKYNILRAGTPKHLITAVEEAIKEGWEPIGGMVVVAAGGAGNRDLPLHYYQTMVQNPVNNFV